MKYFLDCEFIEDGYTIDLISIGLVAEDEREYYALHYGCDYKKANDWVKQNVLPALPPEPLPQMHATTKEFRDSIPYKQGWRNKDLIAEEILEFIGDDPHPEFWGEWCSYDWGTLCQLYGTMMDLPKGWPMRCRDVVQYLEDDLGLSQQSWPVSLETDGNHNALMGARTVKARWEWCNQQS
ncbi:MAG: 3'-5' exoribonuclease domain-containing protein [Leptolyngbyaceae cyanobacterium]